jgi:predicted RNase H-like nuclease (RuvC/YqgF family)
MMPDEIPTQPQINGAVQKLRTDNAEKDIEKLEGKLEELQKIVIEQGNTITALKERLSLFAVGQSILTIIVGAVAAFIGASR